MQCASDPVSCYTAEYGSAMPRGQLITTVFVHPFMLVPTTLTTVCIRMGIATISSANGSRATRIILTRCLLAAFTLTICQYFDGEPTASLPTHAPDTPIFQLLSAKSQYISLLIFPSSDRGKLMQIPRLLSPVPVLKIALSVG